MGQADPSLGDGTLAPYPGLAATLAHGMDFFNRPSGVVIPQFASSLSASLGRLSSEGAQTSQASADQGDAAPPPITSSRDYDCFSDPVARSPPAAGTYDQFSDAVASGPRGVGGPFSDTVTSSQAGPGTTDNSSGAAASDGAPRNIGRPFPDAVASSQVTPATSIDFSQTVASESAARNAGGSSSDVVASSPLGPMDKNSMWDPFGEVAASAIIGSAIAGSNSTEPDAATTDVGATTPANSPGPRRYSNGLTPSEHIAANLAKGKAEERARQKDYEKAGLQVRGQPMFETDCGLRFRLDFLIHDPELDITSDPNMDKIGKIEVKSSEKARLTPNQKQGIPIMEHKGARLVTSFPGFYPSGTGFPPGVINIKRPGDPSLPNDEVEEPPAYVRATEDHIKIRRPGQND